jgi:anaerobic ribonucleoside-triphosphate reductase
MDKAIEVCGEWPKFEDGEKYKAAELELLTEKYGAELAEKAQAFAFKRAEKEIDRATFQAMEALVHNLNTMHSRGGNQVVFSSINYGTDTSAEGRCIIREILNTTYDGVGVNGQTAIFPIQVWKKKRGVSYLPSDRNYDLYQLACKVTARRFFPNFLNLDATFNQSEDWRADDPKRYIHMKHLLLYIPHHKMYKNRGTSNLQHNFLTSIS